MTEEMKVKDIATELGVSTKDLLRALREMDIPAKSTVSKVSGDDLLKVKALFAAQADTSSKREVQPGGVIVRRRKAQVEEVVVNEAAALSQEPQQEEPKQKTPKKDEPKQEVQATAAPQSPEPPKEQEAEAPKPAPKPRRQSKPKEVAAKVISRPEKPEDVKEQPIEEVEEPKPAIADSEKPADIPVQPEPEQVAQEEAPQVDDTKAKADQAAKAARRGQASASANPEGSSAPSLLPPVSDTHQNDPTTEEEGAEQPARAARRAQEQSSPKVRIISKPDAQAVAAAPSRQADPRGRQPAEGDRARDGRGAPRPQGQRPRPAAAEGARFGAAAPPSVGTEHEGQSKKKRNKGRKSNDFAQSDGGFGRRRDDDGFDMTRQRSRRRSKGQQRQAVSVTQPIKAAKRKIRVEEAIRVGDLAHQMGLKAGEIIKVLFNLGIMATINKSLDIDTATVVAAEFGYEVEKSGFAEEDYLVSKELDSPESLKLRPPVVTIMGHVDHGKTSLLDAIRKTNVTGGEAGGITQHIGAYHVTTKSGEIVFLDTPGHEAFTAMRARGAQVTDIVVLVVAADDGVMEQTREAVNHAKAAGVPIMVAVNKMDKAEANPERVLRELAEVGLVPEDWGGDTVVSLVSAKSREGLDSMLELLALQADILELRANPDKPARGHIVEAKLDKGRGPVATVLIQEGTLRQGDTFVCGVFSGKVRALFNDQGRKVKEAGPSNPVEVQGFEGVPEAGEEFVCLADEKLARRIAESRAIKQRERELAKESRVTLETFLAHKSESHTLNLVVKADVQGSQEAIIEALNKQSTEKVRIQIIHGGTGAITESDILLASASDAIVIGFNVRPTAKVKEVAEHENVDIRYYDIIYKLVEEIKSAMAGLLAPISREVYLGQADVRETFSVPKVGTIAGAHVSDGKMQRNAGIRLLRDGVVVYTGKLSSLRRFKEDVREVQKGYECGISLENFNDIKIGDAIEAFEMVEEAATL